MKLRKLLLTSTVTALTFMLAGCTASGLAGYEAGESFLDYSEENEFSYEFHSETYVEDLNSDAEQDLTNVNIDEASAALTDYLNAQIDPAFINEMLDFSERVQLGNLTDLSVLVGENPLSRYYDFTDVSEAEQLDFVFTATESVLLEYSYDADGYVFAVDEEQEYAVEGVNGRTVVVFPSDSAVLVNTVNNTRSPIPTSYYLIKTVNGWKISVADTLINN